ncbi:hypothetical protein BX600DRAFT_501867 [Xylariales sp. PMI_506]|nr:hypothetical protein BX600DRAFT_501867 [Xylariales sp. PMI_506]
MTLTKDYQSYHAWVESERKKHRGVRFNEAAGIEDAFIIPLTTLRAYWDLDRVQHFLSPDLTPKVSADTITNDYLRIFATLVYISSNQHSRIQYLVNFVTKSQDDHHFPFREPESLSGIFSDPVDGQRVKRDFYQNQFCFNHEKLADGARRKLNNAQLANEDILPLHFIRDLNPRFQSPVGPKLKLFEVTPMSGFQDDKKKVVAKIFPRDELEFTFASEIAAYNTLNRDYTAVGSECFLEHHGSFCQNGTGVILLEYADQGSLYEFVEKNGPPHTQIEMINMWKGMIDILRGLAHIHNSAETDPHTMRGVHQDIQLSNIFAFQQTGSDTETPSHYKFKFKIGDFGLSSFQLQADVKKGGMLDNGRTNKYGAPELMTWSSSLDHLSRAVTASVDIWSVGCVLFEMVVWSVCGTRGLEEFHADRLEETRTEAPDCLGSFHNGKTRLQAVDNMAGKLYPRLRAYDSLTMKLCEWICNELLVPKPNDRLNAYQAVSRMEKMIAVAAAIQYPPSPNGYGTPPRQALSTQRPSFGSSYQSFQSFNASPLSQEEYSSRLGSAAQSPGQQFITVLDSSFSHEPSMSESPYRGLGMHRDPQSSSPIAPIARNSTNYIKTGDQSPPSLVGKVNTWHTERNSPAHQPSSTTHGGMQGKFGLDGGNPFSTRGQTSNYRYSTPHIPEEPTSLVTSGSGSQLAIADMEAQDTLQRQSTSIRTTKVGQSGRDATRESRIIVPNRPRPATEMKGFTIAQLLSILKKNQGLPNELRDIPDILKQRDQVFLVDNSVGMIGHWEDVKNTILVLGSIVAPVDPDGVELRFTSKPTERTQKKNINELILEFNKNVPSAENQCMMGRALSILIDDLVPPSSDKPIGSSLRLRDRLKFSKAKKTGISIYILTDAVWGGYDLREHQEEEFVSLGGVDDIVKTLIRRLQKRGENSKQITIQFIRFGHNKISKRRLRHMDNNIKAEAGWDIVDRRYHGRGVRAMLVGAMNERDDLQSDDSDDEDYAASEYKGS